MTNKQLEGWLLSAKPDEIIAEIRRRIREALGDEVENNTTIVASHGYYRMQFSGGGSFPSDENVGAWYDVNFRRGAVKQLAKDLSAAKRKANRPAF